MFSDLYAFHDQPLCVCVLNLLLCFILLWNSFMIHEVMSKKWMPGLSFGYVIIQREINNIRKLCKIVLFLRSQQIQWFSVSVQDTLKRVKDTPVRDVFSQADPGWKIYCNFLNILHVWTLFSLPYNKLYIDINLNKGRLLELFFNSSRNTLTVFCPSPGRSASMESSVMSSAPLN